jgi:hypothetical protein
MPLGAEDEDDDEYEAEKRFTTLVLVLGNVIFVR